VDWGAYYARVKSRGRGLADKRILLTTDNGGVEIIAPFQECLDILTREVGSEGQFDDEREIIAYFMHCGPYEVMKRCDVERSGWRLDLSVEAREDLAWRWVWANQQGGMSEDDAVWLVAECSQRWGHAPELIRYSDLPSREARNAWRRSLNGGPIWVEEEAA
jgi:hypothetical protein